MKKLLFAVLLAGVTTAPAFAQGHDDHYDGHGNGNAPQQHAQPAPRPQAQPRPAPAPQQAQRGNWQGGGHWNQPQQAMPQANAQNYRGWHGQQGGQVQVQGQTQIQGRGQYVPNGGNQAYRGGQGSQAYHNNGQWNHGVDHNGYGWNRDWRRDQRYNWQSYRDQNRGFFHLGVYYNPYGYGYGYRPYDVGFYLDAAFYAPNYWIDDPYEYRLPPAYDDTRWVRYYNDALLIDINTGQVVDVIQNFFW